MSVRVRDVHEPSSVIPLPHANLSVIFCILCDGFWFSVTRGIQDDIPIFWFIRRETRDEVYSEFCLQIVRRGRSWHVLLPATLWLRHFAMWFIAAHIISLAINVSSHQGDKNADTFHVVKRKILIENMF